MDTRSVLTTGAAVALAAVAALTLLPAGSGGGEWGSPAVEVRWYLAGLNSRTTVLQLLGNLLLLAPLAGLAVLRWPVLRRPAVLCPSPSPRAPPSRRCSGRSRWAASSRRWTRCSTPPARSPWAWWWAGCPASGCGFTARLPG